MNLPFDPSEFFRTMTVPCVVFSPGASGPWLNQPALRLAEENPELVSDLAKATSAGEIRGGRVVDLVLVGEVNRFLFEPMGTQGGTTVWMGWNAHNTLFSNGMELTQMIARKLTHEIRNPLQPIQIISDQWQETHPDFAPDAAIIDKQIGRILKVLDHLRGFLDSKPLEIQPLELNSLLNRLTDRMRKFSPANISWSIHRMTDQILIAGEAVRLEKAFESLLRNSLEAMPDGGCLQIATGITGASGTKGYRAYVEISDSGGGMSAEAMGKLFMPFFSTKPEGVGLGLVIARRLFDLHRGELKFASQEGIGTTATVSLPPVGRM